MRPEGSALGVGVNVFVILFLFWIASLSVTINQKIPTYKKLGFFLHFWKNNISREQT